MNVQVLLQLLTLLPFFFNVNRPIIDNATKSVTDSLHDAFNNMFKLLFF